MKRIELMPLDEARSARKVGQKTVAAPEFRHEWLLGASRDAVGTAMVVPKVPSALPPQ